MTDLHTRHPILGRLDELHAEVWRGVLMDHHEQRDLLALVRDLTTWRAGPPGEPGWYWLKHKTAGRFGGPLHVTSEYDCDAIVAHLPITEPRKDER